MPMHTYLDEQTRARAVRYLTRTGNENVIDILGLGDPTPDGICPACGEPMSGLRNACRRKGCSSQPAWKAGKR